MLGTEIDWERETESMKFARLRLVYHTDERETEHNIGISHLPSANELNLISILWRGGGGNKT